MFFQAEALNMFRLSKVNMEFPAFQNTMHCSIIFIDTHSMFTSDYVTRSGKHFTFCVGAPQNSQSYSSEYRVFESKGLNIQMCCIMSIIVWVGGYDMIRHDTQSRQIVLVCMLQL